MERQERDVTSESVTDSATTTTELGGGGKRTEVWCEFVPLIASIPILSPYDDQTLCGLSCCVIVGIYDRLRN
jgi:hypothetical protein